MSGEHSVVLLCEVLAVSRSGYYGWQQRRQRPCARVLQDRSLTVQIREAFATNRQSYGSPRIAEALGRREGVRLRKLMFGRRLI